MANIRKLKSQIRVLETRQKVLRRKIAKASAVVNVIDTKRAVLEQKRTKAYESVTVFNTRYKALEAKINLLHATIVNGGKKPRIVREDTNDGTSG